MIHNKQFAIGPRAVPGWCSHEVAGAVLSICGDLKFRIFEGRVLLGLVYGPDGPADLTGTDSDVVQRSRWWSGRWVLICGGVLYQDVSGLLGVFVSDKWASSSAAILAEMQSLKTVSTELAHGHGQGIDWFPAPVSRFSGLRKLIPGEVIKIRTFSVNDDLRNCRFNLPLSSGSYDELLDKLKDALVGVLKGAAKDAGRVVIPLTGGYDSRLLLSACCAADIDIDIVTVTQRKNIMSWADRELPPRLAKAAGVQHQWIDIGDEIEDRYATFDRHTAGQITGIDRTYFAHGQLDWAQKGDMILRGGALAVGKCAYWNKLPETPLNGEEIAAAFGETDTLKIAGLSAWTDQIVDGLDWRDQFYIDQRVSGWLSSVEQSLDIVDGQRFHAANSLAIYELLLSVPERTRLKSRHHVDLIRLLAPELLRFPFNKEPGIIPWARRIAGRLIWNAKELLN